MTVPKSSSRLARIAAGAALVSSACSSPRYGGTGSGTSDGVPDVSGGTNGNGGSAAATPGSVANPGSGTTGSEVGPIPIGVVQGPPMEVDTSGGQVPAVCAYYDSEAARVHQIPDPDTNAALEARVESIPLDQRIRQMYGFPNCSYNSGTQCFEQQPIADQNLPVWEMRDGPRGVKRLGAGPSTAFPTPGARAASFDIDLEERIGDWIGRQMLAFKYDLMLAPAVNTLRHPGWGRSQETYGEDTVVLGEMGAALVRGIQLHVPTCIKHFAANTTEGNRRTMSANMDLQTLREIYTRQFMIAVEKSDPACVMAAYNRVNNTFSAENSLLLTDILRKEWNWKGFVISDWGAAKSTAPSALAGLDLEMPNNTYYGSLLAQVPAAVPVARINEAVRRVLNVKRHFGQLNDAYQTDDAYQNRAVNESIINDPTVLALAEEAAEKGMVLLENRDNLLPLAAGTRILVAGPDGNIARLGDSGSSQVTPAENLVVNPLQGLQAVGAAHGATVDYQAELAAAVQAAPGYGAVVLVVSMQHTDEGEGYGGGDDRESLDLNGPHPELWPAGQKPRTWIQQLSAANPNLIVVLNVGGAIVEPSLESAKALLYSFYPGQAGGTALARLLFGDVNFSGKLPFTVASDPSQYPTFGDTGAAATYDYFHGYRKFDADPSIQPRYYFGSGVSYSAYQYSNLAVACSEGVSENGMLVAEVDVTNTSDVAGTEIVQLYIGYPNTAVRRSVKELKAFRRVDLDPGQTKRVQLSVPARDFRYYDLNNGWQTEFVEHQVLVGPSADPARLLTASFNVMPG